MTPVAVAEATKSMKKENYRISNLVLDQLKDLWITYRRKNKTHHSAVSPHRSDPNEGRNEGRTRAKCSNAVDAEHELGTTFHSVHSVLNCIWPMQICEADATLELVLDGGCWVEAEERRFVGAEGDVFGGLGR